LKLKYDNPLSVFAFNFNLRRYVERTGTTGVGIYDFNFVRALIADALITTPGNYLMDFQYTAVTVGRCRLTLWNPR